MWSCCGLWIGVNNSMHIRSDIRQSHNQERSATFKPSLTEISRFLTPGTLLPRRWWDGISHTCNTCSCRLNQLTCRVLWSMVHAAVKGIGILCLHIVCDLLCMAGKCFVHHTCNGVILYMYRNMHVVLHFNLQIQMMLTVIELLKLLVPTHQN